MADSMVTRLRVKPGSGFTLSQRDPDETFGWDKDIAKVELVDVLARIDALQQRLAAEARRGLLVVLQAMDGAGKDSTIRAIFGQLNAEGVRVDSFKAPVGHELTHDYLWRIHALTPAAGEIGVWNRSHYENVLIVRVKHIVPKHRWQKRYHHIREFERLLSDEGTRVVKIHLQISNEEQRRRLQDRIDDPNKHWKFRAADLEDRALWPQFMKAYEAAINETTTREAPWYVVPANRKWVRNLAIARILCDTLERMDPELPPDDPSIRGVVVP